MADSKSDVINPYREKFMNNEKLITAVGCLLVPRPGWPLTYIRVCGDSVGELAIAIRNKLTDQNNNFNIGVDGTAWQNMLFSAASANDRAQFVNDDSGHVYFDWVKSETTLTKKDGVQVALLDAMRAAYADVKESEIVSADPTRYLTDVGTKLQNFVWTHKLPLTLALLVLAILSFLLLADDPRSVLPKETYKWFATTSPLKKVVDAGRHWDTHYGNRRPGQQQDLPPRPGQQQDLPPQGILQGVFQGALRDNMRPPELPRVPTDRTGRMTFFSSALNPVKDTKFLLNGGA